MALTICLSFPNPTCPDLPVSLPPQKLPWDILEMMREDSLASVTTADEGHGPYLCRVWKSLPAWAKGSKRMGSKTGTEKLWADASKVEMGQKHHLLGMELLHPGDWLWDLQYQDLGHGMKYQFSYSLEFYTSSCSLKVWFESWFLEICNLE